MSVSPEFIAALRDATLVAPEANNDHHRAAETYERLKVHEASLVSLGKVWKDVVLKDYENGSATEVDQVWVGAGFGTQVVASADHATDPYTRSKNEYRRADYGTGGIVMLLAEENRAAGVAPRGRQTWNVAVSDDTHPVKRAIRGLLPERQGFVSVHGMFSGKLRELTDPTEVHAVIGLGANPNELSWEAAKKVVLAAKDLGLRLSIANSEALRIYEPKTGGFQVNEDTQTVVTSRLAGSKPAMTNAFAYKIMEETGVPRASMQLEMAGLLRLQTIDDVDAEGNGGGWHSDERSRMIGTYVGYELIKAAVEAVKTH